MQKSIYQSVIKISSRFTLILSSIPLSPHLFPLDLFMSMYDNIYRQVIPFIGLTILIFG
jgi:hypothetical protein